ncbi:MAG: AraC family transcriptional regulator [Chitinophagaceae bacterium]|nr:MAG: AraC family transcriptional regulator [Chitinophagaceae bacterium]
MQAIVNGTSYQLEPGIACCIPPGQWYQCVPPGDLAGYHLQVPADLLYQMENTSALTVLSAPAFFNGKPLLLSVDGSMEMAGDIIQRMEYLLANLTPGDSEILKGYLHLFLLYLSRPVQPLTWTIQGREKSIVDEFLSLVRQKFTCQKMVAEYASDLCVTASYLNRVVKRVSGHTASHYIQQQVIREAKRLCRHNIHSMKEIAFALGFSDIAHFSKFFKNYTGVNFSSFKKDVHPRNPCPPIC